VPTYLHTDKIKNLFGNESNFEEAHYANNDKDLKNNANSIKIVRTTADIQLVANLAHTIWNEHYVPIVGQDQVSYMLKTFQSAGAIEKQIKTENFEYYIINHLSEPSGYLAIKPSGNELFLSKFYVVKEKRGTGLGKHGLQFVIKRATELGIKTITLTVNKNNIGSIKAYEKMGFITTGAVIADIGAGFVMDDFKMEYAI
jgi:RimJ/RimL family protein N-acetyltransferase